MQKFSLQWGGIFLKKNYCVICGAKASIWTRQVLSDGFLCSACAKQCSEHITRYRDFSTDDIVEHLRYRKENYESERLAEFVPTLSLGEYEILRVDENNGYWLLKTEKRFNNTNPDIFLLSQITDVKMIKKRECLNNFNENKKNGRKFKTKKNRFPIYGYWFYIIIKVNHPFFDTINMRINKYIINEKNQIEFLGALCTAQKITEKIRELSEEYSND